MNTVIGGSNWLTQRQMGKLFDTTPENALMHLKNIFSDNELEEDATTKDFSVVQIKGTCQVQRNLKHYNLDGINFSRVPHQFETRRSVPPMGDTRAARTCGEALQGILGSIEQTMFGESLYKSREEKAAHLLYFVFKDHPFSDGNKRIGSFTFLLCQNSRRVPASKRASFHSAPV